MKYVFAYGWAPFKKPELRLFKGKKKWVQKPELALRRMNEPPEPKNDKRYLVCFRDASASPVFRIVDLEKDIEYAEGEMPPEFHRMPAHCINDSCEIIGRGLSNCFKYVFAYGWDPYKKPELRLFKGKKKWVKKPVLALRPVARDDVPWPLRKRKDYLSTHYYDDPNHLYDDDFWVGRV